MSIASSNMKFASFVLTGYLDGIEKIRKDMDSVPYEKFPYCCSSDNIVKQDLNLKRPKTIIYNKKPVAPVITSTKNVNQTFWTPQLILKYSNIKSAY